MRDLSEAIANYRLEHYRQLPPLQISTQDGALAFFEEAGFCLFYRHAALELPNLRDATAGDRGTSEGLNWGWKDALIAGRRVYYGKVLDSRPGFIALSLLAARYALAPVADYGGDAQGYGLEGGLSAEAQRIATVVEEAGPLPTRRLRALAGLSGAGDHYRFQRGLTEAQAQFLVTAISVTSATRGSYSYIWDTFPRAWPDQAEAGLRLSVNQAAVQLIPQYLQTVGAASPEMVGRVLGLSATQVQQIAAALPPDQVAQALLPDGPLLLTPTLAGAV